VQLVPLTRHADSSAQRVRFVYTLHSLWQLSRLFVVQPPGHWLDEEFEHATVQLCDAESYWHCGFCVHVARTAVVMNWHFVLHASAFASHEHSLSAEQACCDMYLLRQFCSHAPVGVRWQSVLASQSAADTIVEHVCVHEPVIEFHAHSASVLQPVCVEKRSEHFCAHEAPFHWHVESAPQNVCVVWDEQACLHLFFSAFHAHPLADRQAPCDGITSHARSHVCVLSLYWQSASASHVAADALANLTLHRIEHLENCALHWHRPACASHCACAVMSPHCFVHSASFRSHTHSLSAAHAASLPLRTTHVGVHAPFANVQRLFSAHSCCVVCLLQLVTHLPCDELHAHCWSPSQAACAVCRYSHRCVQPAAVDTVWHIGDAAHSIEFCASSEHFCVHVPVFSYHVQSVYDAQASLVFARSVQVFVHLPAELTRHCDLSLQFSTVTASVVTT